MTHTPRASGILMPVPALPGGYGIGDLGFPADTTFDDLREGEAKPTAWAYRFVDYLAAAGQTYWQVLPLGPTGYGNSPYQCLSAFAGNPDLISLDWLRAHGLLKGRSAVLGDAVAIMHLLWAIETKPNNPTLRRKKAAPVLVQEGSIGLHAIENTPTGRLMFTLQCHDPAKVIQPQDCRFSAMP